MIKVIFSILFVIPFCFGQNFSSVNQFHFGTSDADNLAQMIVCADNGFLCISNSTGSDHDKTQASYGDADFWVVRLNADKSIRWEKTIGGSLFDSPVSVVETTGGGFMILGESFSGADGVKTSNNFGNKDYWLVKLDASGTVVLDKNYGSAQTDSPTSLVQVNSNEFVLIGSSNGGVSGSKTTASNGFEDIWAVSIDSNGVENWQANYGGSDSENTIGCAAMKLSNNHVLLISQSYSGISGNKTSPNYGWNDAWILEVDNLNGQLIRQVTLGGSQDEIICSSIERNNEIILVGSSRSDISGTKTSDLKGIVDAWVVTLASDFSILSDNSYGGTAYSSFNRIMATDNGYIASGAAGNDSNPWVTGTINGSSDAWLVGFDNAGVYNWNYTFGTTDGLDYITDVIELSHNHFGFSFLSNSTGQSGDLTQSNHGSFDFYFIELDTDLGIVVHAMNEDQMQIYPNPTAQYIHVNYKTFTPTSHSEIKILNSIGQVIHLFDFNSTTDSYDVSSLAPGSYWMEIDGNVSRFVKN